MTKEEKIKEAYNSVGLGYLVEQCDNEAWVEISAHIRYVNEDKLDRIAKNRSKHYIRPKSISEIVTNNGWIKIKSEDDLPTIAGTYYTTSKSGLSGTLLYDGGERIFEDITENQWWMKYISHYQPIVKPKPPIY